METSKKKIKKILRKLLRYVVIFLIIILACRFVPSQEINFGEIFIIAVMGAITFCILDMYYPIV